MLKYQGNGIPVTGEMTCRVTTVTDLSQVSSGFQRRDSCTFPYCHIVRQHSGVQRFLCSHETVLAIKYQLSSRSNEGCSQDWLIPFDVKSSEMPFMFVCSFPDVVQYSAGCRAVCFVLGITE